MYNVRGGDCFQIHSNFNGLVTAFVPLKHHPLIDGVGGVQWLPINPYPAPGNVVGTVHGRRDTRTAAGGAP